MPEYPDRGDHGLFAPIDAMRAMVEIGELPRADYVARLRELIAFLESEIKNVRAQHALGRVSDTELQVIEHDQADMMAGIQERLRKGLTRRSPAQ